MELKLHEAIEIILKEYDRPMTSREIADEVNKRGYITVKLILIRFP